MKKLGMLSGTILIALFAIVRIHAQVEVIPEQYDFGEVQLGDTESQDFAISNQWWGQLLIENTQLVPGSGGNFTLVNTPLPGTVILPGSMIFFGVNFSPGSEGLHSAHITIHWTNGQNGISTVALSGIGIAEQPPPFSIQDVIDFFDASVATGSLEGTGPGNSAENRLNAFRNMLIQADYFFSAGNYEAACEQLGAALKRCHDFVQGAAAADLKLMIAEVMSDLGC